MDACFLFMERKILSILILTNDASFVFLQNKGHTGISSIGNFKNSGCPFKNCYSYISCTEMRSTILSVVRMVASRSTNVPVYRNRNKVKAQALSRTGNPYSFSILFWRLKIPKANNHFFLVFDFMDYSTFCVFDWHILIKKRTPSLFNAFNCSQLR